MTLLEVLVEPLNGLGNCGVVVSLCARIKDRNWEISSSFWPWLVPWVQVDRDLSLAEVFFEDESFLSVEFALGVDLPFLQLEDFVDPVFFFLAVVFLVEPGFFVEDCEAFFVAGAFLMEEGFLVEV